MSASPTSGRARPATSTGTIPVVGEVDRKIADLLGLPLAASEPLQGQRYAPGQEFKPHTDTFEPGGYDFLRPHRRHAASAPGRR